MGRCAPRRRSASGSPRRPALLPAVLAAVMAAATGCALVPTGGPVVSGRAVQPADPIAGPYVRVLPDGPQPGATPEQVVRGFLAASASFRGDHAIARRYLAPTVRSEWKPERGTRVYGDGSGFGLLVEQPSKKDAVVTMKADQLATVGARGQYRAADSGSRLTARFRLRTVGGQWRIVSFPQGLLLTDRDVARAYRTLNLYFFEPGLEVLVPNPIHVPAGDRGELATRLARGLVRGATSWLAPSVRNAFPEDTDLLGDVSIDEGRATVNLGGAAASADRQATAYMSAQLAWTLEQLPNVERIRLQIEGEAVSLPDAGEVIDTEDWASLDPAALSGTVHAYMVRGERLFVTSQEEPQPAPGPAGSGGVPVHNPAVSLDAKHAAWLSESGGELYVGELRESGDRWSPLSAERLRSPSWDRHGNLWVVEDGDDGSIVWMIDTGTEATRVAAPGLDGVDVRSLRVARDGTRIAILAGQGETTRLLLGRIERADGGARIEGLTPLPTDLARVVDVAWRDAEQLAVLGKDVQGVMAPYLVDIAGGAASPAGSVGSMVSIAAAPRTPMLAGLQSGEVYRTLDNLGWEPLGAGAQPAYPG